MLNFMRIMAIISDQIYIERERERERETKSDPPHLIRHGSFEKKAPKIKAKSTSYKWKSGF